MQKLPEQQKDRNGFNSSRVLMKIAGGMGTSWSQGT